MPASRTSCTNATQAGSFVGTATPLEQRRPEIDINAVDSASANAAFSTACHPPNVLVRGSVDMLGSWPGTNFSSPGLSACAEKTTLAAGYKTPRINWFRSAGGGTASADGVCAVSDNPHAASARKRVSAVLSMRPRLVQRAGHANVVLRRAVGAKEDGSI